MTPKTTRQMGSTSPARYPTLIRAVICVLPTPFRSASDLRSTAR